MLVLIGLWLQWRGRKVEFPGGRKFALADEVVVWTFVSLLAGPLDAAAAVAIITTAVLGHAASNAYQKKVQNGNGGVK